MNKKFLSAILFGALMATSAGTFVSCKDYDDDIKNLQTQIDTNKTAIAELQKLVGAGNWVTNVAASGESLVVTMSNGTSATIAGIKGADGKDGKNAAEWTIGEDGFWYVNGEKTANVAVAKNGENGKNGATAPSPSISENGMWVVYSWDEAKGEFVAEETEIPAAGTSAYAVKANGVYTLFVADENGEMQEIVLPATSDAFVAAAPGSAVHVYFEEATWTPVTTKTKKEQFAKVAKVFPELNEYKKDDLMKQGGNLPLLITPANVELTDDFSFSLQSVKGEISKAILSNPVKGMPTNVTVNRYGEVSTRAAKAEECFWTLSVEPAKNKKGNAYEAISEPHSLVVVNEKGTVVKTAFAYTLDVQDNEDVTINESYNKLTTKVDYAEAIDVFAQNEEGEAVFVINHGLNGYYVLEATDLLDVEKYGITIEGGKLMVADIPANQTAITVDLKLTAVGLNGSVAEKEVPLTIGNQIASNGVLADKDVTLGHSSTTGYLQNVRWNIADFKFTATQLDNFLKAKKTMVVTYENEEGEEVTEATYTSMDKTLQVFDKNGKNENSSPAVAITYKNAATIGFKLDSQIYEPREYKITLIAEDVNDAVIYKAEAALNVSNPESGVVIKLADAFVDADGVLQITGTPGASHITYNLANAFVLKNAAIYTNFVDPAEEADGAFVDMDATEEDLAWTDATGALSVAKYNYADVTAQKLYKTRNFKVRYYMFNNRANWSEFEFQAEVISEIWSEDPTAAIVMDATKLTATFDAAKDADQKINVASAVTKAILAAGADRGKTYNLFAIAGTTTPNGPTITYKYNVPEHAGDFVLGADGNIVELTLVEYLKMFDAFGTTDKAYFLDGQNATDIETGDAKYKLTLQAWEKIWNVASKFYNTDGTPKYRDVDGDNKIDENDYIADTDKDGVADSPVFIQNGRADYNTSNSWGTDYTEEMAIYTSFKENKIAFTYTETPGVGSTTTGAVDRDSRVKDVTIEFADATVASKYATISDNVISAKSGLNEDIPAGQVVLGVKMTIEDAWGMKMVRTFDVTLKTVK